MGEDQSVAITDPLAELVRAHRDIEVRVAQLETAGRQLRDEAYRAVALSSIKDVLAFFDGPGATHHADEQDSLFPRLRPVDAFSQMLGAFDVQHQMNDETHAALRRAVADVGSTQALRSLVGRFVEMNRGHMFAEEQALFPKAAEALSGEALAEIAAEMTARRGG